MARRAPDCVVHMYIGGVGGRRILGVTPEPAPWSARSDRVHDRRSVRGSPFEFADVDGGAGGRLAQLSKPLSVGCEMDAFSSGQGARAPMSSLMSLPGAVKKYESTSVSAEV